MKYILLLNGRRRVYITEKIKEYLSENFFELGIALTDTDYLDPVGYHADKFNLLPPIENEIFEEKFLNYLQNENIVGIFLWNNKDFPIIYKLKDKIIELGINILLPSLECINICFDKRKTYEFLKLNDIKTPNTYKSIDEFIENGNNYPVIIKPYDGAGNQNVFIADNFLEVKAIFNKVKNAIIQDYIQGTHYTIDVFVANNGKIICSIPRKRIKVRDAEVVQAQIEMKENVIKVGEKVANKLKIIGPINIQVIENSKNEVYVIDIHPRFGGGTDLTIQAGVPFHEWIVNLLLGLEIDETYVLNEKLFMTRYLKSYFFEKGSE